MRAEYYKKLLRLKKLEINEQIKYDKLYNKISSDVELEDIIVSPFEEVRDIILNQSDVVKKYNDILLFISNCCYEKDVGFSY